MSVHDQFCSDIFKFCTDISDSVLPFHKLIHELQLHFKYYHLQTSRADSTFHRGPNMTVVWQVAVIVIPHMAIAL